MLLLDRLPLKSHISAVIKLLAFRSGRQASILEGLATKQHAAIARTHTELSARALDSHRYLDGKASAVSQANTLWTWGNAKLFTSLTR